LCNQHQRRPRQLVPSKKRKVEGGTQAVENAKRGNIIRYYNFIANAVDILYQQGWLKSSYIVVDNTPVHKNTDFIK
jgi:hypothetical protein